MSADLDLALQYRKHANELRLMAEDPKFKSIRASLLSIAGDYDALGDQLEAVDKTNQELARRIKGTS